jgi:AcrR family transcriptional regulator
MDKIDRKEAAARGTASPGASDPNPAGLSPSGPAPLSAAEERILEAARTLFFAEGVAAVSTDRLCRQAGVSKSTLYKYFGDMGGVLTGVVRREGDSFTTGVMTAPDTADAFWGSLIAYGINLLTLLNQPHCIQFDRMLHEEARQRPEISRPFYDAAYGRSHQDVTALVAHGQARGYIRKPQRAEWLADNLISMWEGLAYTRTRLGLADRPYPDPPGWARHCVEVLFEGDMRS